LTKNIFLCIVQQAKVDFKKTFKINLYRILSMYKSILLASMSLGIALPLNAIADSKFNGFYAGVQTGYTKGTDKGQEYEDGVADGWTQKTTPGSVLIGGFLGFNKVLENNMLIGFEADYEYRGSSDKSFQNDEGVPDTDYQIETKLKDAASLRARLGYAVNGGNTLGYVTAGYTSANINRTVSDLSEALSESHSKRHDGWTVGFGAEHLIGEKISIKTEYRYANYSRESISAAEVFDGDYQEKQKYQNEHSGRVGVAYHF
jgi:outer membrane immunogenic protein